MRRNLGIYVIAAACVASPAYAGASLGNDYDKFKNTLSNDYNIDYNLDYSIMAQHASPGGKYNAVQSYLAPSIAWTTFDNQYGTGILNASYYSIFYGNHNAQDIQNRTGMATSINDFVENEQEFAALYYTYQLPRK